MEHSLPRGVSCEGEPACVPALQGCYGDVSPKSARQRLWPGAPHSAALGGPCRVPTQHRKKLYSLMHHEYSNWCTCTQCHCPIHQLYSNMPYECILSVCIVHTVSAYETPGTCMISFSSSFFSVSPVPLVLSYPFHHISLPLSHFIPLLPIAWLHSGRRWLVGW